VNASHKQSTVKVVEVLCATGILYTRSLFSTWSGRKLKFGKNISTGVRKRKYAQNHNVAGGLRRV